MPKMIQIRNVPDTLHAQLKARAALDGRSLSDYLLAELERAAERPTLRQLRQRLEGREPVVLEESLARMVRHERESR